MLKNNSKKTILCENTHIITSLFGKARGLMFTTKKDRALVFVNTRDEWVPLHMFFVFYSIDVLYCDKDKKVLEIKKNFRPFTLYHPSHKARYVIETLSGVISKSNTQVGDILTF